MTAALRRPPPDPRLLQRCLLLAVLLHVWLVLMFGNAAGTAAPGQGVWGSLTVKLLGRSGSQAEAPPGTTTDAGNPQRSSAAQPSEPGATRPGHPDPQDAPPEVARSDEASAAPASTATLDLPEGFRPIERQDLSSPPRSSRLPVPTPDLPAAAIGRIEERPDAAVSPLSPAASLRTLARPVELPARSDLPAPVSRLDGAPTTTPATALPRPAELRVAPPTAAAAPSAELPPPVRRLELPSEPSFATPLPRAADLRAAPATATSLPATSDALPATVQRLEAPTAADGAAVTPLARSSELRTASPNATAAPALPGAQDLPSAVRRLEPADAGNGVAPLQPAPSARVSGMAPGSSALSDLSGAVPGSVSAPAGPARGDPNANPYATPKGLAGAPDASSRLGADLPAPPLPPTAAASAARAPLNLSLPRGELAARRSPGLVELLPPPPERKSKLEQSMEDAANKDCRKAYAGAGILAVVPLAMDAVRGKGCNW